MKMRHFWITYRPPDERKVLSTTFEKWFLAFIHVVIYENYQKKLFVLGTCVCTGWGILKVKSWLLIWLGGILNYSYYLEREDSMKLKRWVVWDMVGGRRCCQKKHNDYVHAFGFLITDLIIGICFPISGLKTATKRQVFAFKHQSAIERQMRGWVNLDEESITFIFQCCSHLCHIFVT